MSATQTMVESEYANAQRIKRKARIEAAALAIAAGSYANESARIHPHQIIKEAIALIDAIDGATSGNDQV